MTTVTVNTTEYAVTTTETGVTVSVTPVEYSVTTAVGVSDFLGLLDTPDAYSGHGLDLVQVNAGSTGLSFISPSLLVRMVQTTADNTGATNATNQLQTDLAFAIAAGHKRLYLPAGTYKISRTTGAILNLTAAGCELFGDGVGKTILQFDDNVTLTGEVYTIQLNAERQYVHDLSIYGGAGLVPGSWAFDGVFANYTASDCLIERVEVVGTQGGPATSTGFGFGTYRLYDYVERTTTLTAAISSTGSQIATPASMRSIFVGALIKVGAEFVTVTARTATTFTAVFIATHAIGSTVSIMSFGHQRITFRDCIVRDAHYSTAYGVNSNGNTFINCRATNIGDASLRHGFYIQGGGNLFLRCYAEGISGYSFHGWKKVPSIESGGDTFVGCHSIDPGTAHMIISALPSDGTNPSVPSGTDLARYTQVSDCTFKSRYTNAALTFSIRVMFDGNVVENGSISAVDEAGSIFTNNKFIYSAFTSAITCGGITTTGGCVIANNHMDLGTVADGSEAIHVSGNDTVVRGNYIRALGNGRKPIVLDGDRILVEGNYIEGSVSNAIRISANALVLRIRNNTIVTTSGAGIDNNLAGRSGFIENNDFIGGATYIGTGSAALLLWRNNKGQISASGRTHTTFVGTEGLLFQTTYDTSGAATITVGLLAKWANGKLTRITTSDTVFAAVAFDEALNAGEALLYGMQRDMPVPVATDGAWSVGNVGVVSSTSAGKIHDSGLTTAPASGSYVLFLDSGGSAGTARCMLVKTV